MYFFFVVPLAGYLLALMWRFARSQYRIVSKINKLPGPKELPFPFGSYLGLAETHAGQYRQAWGHYRTFGKVSPYGIYRMWMGPRAFVTIAKGSTAERILSTSKYMEKGEEYKMLQPWLGTGLLTSTGNKWLTRRKFLTPAFHFQILNDYMGIFYEQSQILITALAEKAKSGEVFDISPYISRCTLDIISEAAMGKKIFAQTHGTSEYVRGVYRITELIFFRMSRPVWYADILYYTFGKGQEFRRTLKTLHDFTNAVISDRRQKMQQGQRPSMSSKHIPFLDLLLQARTEDGNPLDNASIREEVDTFMFEGHDTTAAAASIAVFLLGAHPEIQKQAIEEVDAVFDRSERQPTVEDLKRLPYLESILKETLRFYPPVPFIQRKIHEDFQVGDDVIPKGCSVLLFIAAMHRDPDVFPEPDRFNPSRFLEGNGIESKTPFDYVPFSAGPRNCIGQRFALMEEKVLLSTLLRSYTVRSVETLDEFEVQGVLLTRPVDGVKVTLTRRH